MAMMDGLELGNIIVDNFLQCKSSDGDTNMITTLMTHKFCARKIYEQRLIRCVSLFTIASIALIVAIRAMSTLNLSQVSSVCHNDPIVNQTQNVVRWHKRFRKKNKQVK
jgi:hypothetical protein